MTERKFAKLLSANDAGSTGSHQAGILVPKSNPELLAFLPGLDAGRLNPDAWMVCEGDGETEWRLRYIYYNNKLHTPGGTRNEYRLTHLTTFLRMKGARAGDSLIFSATNESLRYKIAIESARNDPSDDGIIRLRGWRRVC